jgi:hypothetical protein
MQAHVRVEQIAVYHEDPGSDAAQHGDEPNCARDGMALPEKLCRFAEMEAPGALQPKVGRINGKEDGAYLGDRMDAEDESHYY